MTIRTKAEIISLLEEAKFKVIKVSKKPLKYGKGRSQCDMFAAVPILNNNDGHEDTEMKSKAS